MLTAKQNMIECMKAGGNPDRFVNQHLFEFLDNCFY